MYNVALAGATGAVGYEFLKLFEELNFPVGNLTLLASERSAGSVVQFRGKELKVQVLSEDSFEDVDIAFFSAGAERSKQFAPAAVKAGAVVIDNSSAFRMDPDIPLVVPECNPEDLDIHRGIIANPNCSTIQMVVALKPLHDAAKIERVTVATYQAVSGSGAKAIEEMENQMRSYVAGDDILSSVYPAQILNNCIPQVDVFTDNGFTKEEMKMVNETKKILHSPNMRINATCVRVPVFRSHSESVVIETEKKLSAEEALKILKNSPGIVVKDVREPGGYPTPLEVSGTLKTYVGRMREDISHPKGLCFWVVADQLYKGAALNSIQIAEELIKRNQLRR